MGEENKDYIKISQLMETNVLNPDAMFMVSETTTSDGNYVSKRIAVGQLSGQLEAKIVNDLRQATESYGAVDKASTLNDVLNQSQTSAIVTVGAARAMYDNLKGGQSPTGNFLSKDSNTKQTVVGPVEFSSGLSCKTTEITTGNNLAVVNCKMLIDRENDSTGRYPFIGGYVDSVVSSFAGDGKENYFFVGIEKSCTANIKVASTNTAGNIGVAILCSGCTSYQTIDGLVNFAKANPDDLTIWHPIHFFQFQNNSFINTRCIPCDKNTVLMFYALNTQVKSADDETLFGKAGNYKKIAIPKTITIQVNQYRKPSLG